MWDAPGSDNFIERRLRNRQGLGSFSSRSCFHFAGEFNFTKAPRGFRPRLESGKSLALPRRAGRGWLGVTRAAVSKWWLALGWPRSARAVHRRPGSTKPRAPAHPPSHRLANPARRGSAGGGEPWQWDRDAPALLAATALHPGLPDEGL